MATPVEDQVHAVFFAKEEARCREVEALTGKPVKPRDVPKPWRRTAPQALLQDPEFLQHVTELDYLLEVPSFQQFCLVRGVLHVAGEPGSRRREFFVDHAKTKDQFFADRYFQHAESGDGYAYTRAEMEGQWRVITLGRAALQDAWEVYWLTHASAREASRAASAPPEQAENERPAAPRKPPPAKNTGSATPRKTANAPAKSKARRQVDLFQEASGQRRRR